jgi:methyltransferase
MRKILPRLDNDFLPLMIASIKVRGFGRMYEFLILSLVTAQRITEFIYSHRNKRLLVEKGGFEVGRLHYVLLVALHAAWLASLWWYAWDRPIHWGFVIAYLIVQLVRAWTLMALGPRWTIEIVVTPDEVAKGGPTHFLKQPNYLVVAAEILVLPLVFGLWWLALLFSVLNGLMLYWGMRIEQKAIEPANQDGSLTEL